MNKLWEFIDRCYVETARSRGYEDSVSMICELLCRHVETAAMVFRSGEDGAMSAACHASKEALSCCPKQYETPSEKVLSADSSLAASVAAISQLSLNIHICGMLEGWTGDSVAMVVPIVAGTERLGTLVMLREFDFSSEELIIGEAAAVVLAANMRAIKNEREASSLKDTAAVRAALGTLSYSELEASAEVLRRLDGDEGSIVAARVADESRATRSAIVNALRKLESAGLLESHSMGVKGTYIKIRTPILREELRKFDK